MLLGADTGFFIQLKNAHPMVLTIWKQVIDEAVKLIVSTVSINEILVHYYRRCKSNDARELLKQMKALGNIDFVPVTEDIAEKSAGYRYALNLSTIDSLVLATFVAQGCDQIITTDGDFKIAEEQKICKVMWL